MSRGPVGDGSRLGFLALASLRSHLIRQPVLAALTTLTIALNVALVVALGESSRGVNEALERAGRALRGHADLEITAGPAGMPESILDQITSIPAVATAAPVVESVVRISGGQSDGRALRILGVDLLADQAVRDYKVLHRDLRVLDPLALVARNDSIVISEILARQLGLTDGGTLRVRSSSGEHDLIVRGVLVAGGIADAYAGQLAIMDVYALQAMISRVGFLDRVDVVLKSGTRPDDVEAAVGIKTQGIATVRRPNQDNSLVNAAVSTLTFTASVIALVGTLVAGLLSYAAIAASVDRRSRLFALFRAAGLVSGQLIHLVYIDSLIAGLAAVSIGIPLGLRLSTVFGSVFSSASSFISKVDIRTAQTSIGVLLVAGAVGIGISLLSARIAARRLVRLSPHEALTGGRGLAFHENEGSSLPRWRAVVSVVAAYFALKIAPFPMPTTWRATLTVALGIGLLWATLELLLRTVLPLARATLEWMSPGVGRVAVGGLLLRLNQTRIATASIGVVVATTSSIWIVITSLVNTIDTQVATRGGAIVAASDTADSRSGTVLREDTVQRIASTPGVDAVLRQYVTEIAFRDQTIRVSAVTSDVLAERMGLSLREPLDRDREVVSGLQRGGVLVYEAFQRRFGVSIGDSVVLNTPKGQHEFPIVGVVYRYDAGSAGGVRMDLSTFDRYWPRPGTTMVVVWGRGEERARLEAVRQAAGDLQPLFIYPASEVGPHTILKRYSRLVSALLGLIALLAGIAVANLLVSSANDLRGDMALLQCLGASRRRIASIALAQGLSVGVAGVFSAAMLTGLLAPPLKAILTDQFGWSIAWSIHAPELALLGAATVVASALIGLAMGTRLRRTISWSALAPE